MIITRFLNGEPLAGALPRLTLTQPEIRALVTHRKQLPLQAPEKSAILSEQGCHFGKDTK